MAVGHGRGRRRRRSPRPGRWHRRGGRLRRRAPPEPSQDDKRHHHAEVLPADLDRVLHGRLPGLEDRLEGGDHLRGPL
eukprot:5004434-Alexandrium_andersonii.AAC.1